MLTDLLKIFFDSPHHLNCVMYIILYTYILIYFPHNKINGDECTLHTHINEYTRMLIHIRYAFNILRKITKPLCNDSKERRLCQANRTESFCHVYNTLSRQELWISFNNFWLMLPAGGLSKSFLHWHESNVKIKLYYRRYSTRSSLHLF